MSKSSHVLTLAIMALLVVPLLGSAPTYAASCTFVLGFQAIHDQMPAIVGDCLVDQHYNPDNGDALQETTNGLMVWRKADNFTAYTDGYRSWVNGPFGLQQRVNTERFDWEASAPTPAQPAATTVVPQAPAGFDASRYIGQGDRYNCDDFRSQADAQAVLRADPADPNRLDRERDGIACESNPAPYDRNPVPR